MENQNCQQSQGELLQHLGNLRKMMVHNHELENLSEFVLHDLCNGPCFHINKAAYFINNPDFNMLRGITGYDKKEAMLHDTWNNQKEFIASMQNSRFNQKVRNKLEKSFEQGQISQEYMIRKLADYLEMDKPAYHVWNAKHANHGLLLYEQSSHAQGYHQDYVRDSLYYLSFCPVF